MPLKCDDRKWMCVGSKWNSEVRCSFEQIIQCAKRNKPSIPWAVLLELFKSSFNALAWKFKQINSSFSVFVQWNLCAILFYQLAVCLSCIFKTFKDRAFTFFLLHHFQCSLFVVLSTLCAQFLFHFLFDLFGGGFVTDAHLLRIDQRGWWSTFSDSIRSVLYWCFGIWSC